MIYGQNIISEAAVRKGCRMFVNGQTNLHVENKSGWLAIVSDDFVWSIDQKIVER
jgi:hypothetical protein